MRFRYPHRYPLFAGLERATVRHQEPESPALARVCGAAMGCRETHLKLVDHQQHVRSKPLIPLNARWRILIRYPLRNPSSVVPAGPVHQAGGDWRAWTAQAGAQGMGGVRRMACANAIPSALR